MQTRISAVQCDDPMQQSLLTIPRGRARSYVYDIGKQRNRESRQFLVGADIVAFGRKLLIFTNSIVEKKRAKTEKSVAKLSEAAM